MEDNEQRKSNLDAMAARVNQLAGIPKPTGHAKSAHARWGDTDCRQPRVSIAVSESLAREFQAKFPSEYRRAAADFGIRHAVDHAAAIIAFKDATRE